MNKKLIWGVVTAVVVIVAAWFIYSLATTPVLDYGDRSWREGNNSPVTSDWKTYTNLGNSYEVSYPNNWEIETRADGSVIFLNPARKGRESTDEPSEGIGFYFTPMSAKCSPSSWENRVGATESKVVCVLHDNKEITIVATAFDEQGKGQIEKVLSTFKFTSPTPALKTETVKPVSTTPSIKVVSPNGGETLYIGKQQKITWIDDHDVSNVFIYAINKDKTGLGSNISGDISVRSSGIDGTSSYVWNIGSVYPLSDSFGMGIAQENVYSGQYKLNICNRDTKKCDSSDNYFTVAIDSTLTPAITLLSPKNGETVKIGKSFPIYWDTNRIIPLGYKFIINAGSGDRAFDAYSATTSYGYYYLVDKYRITGDILGDVSPGQYKIKVSLYDGIAPRDANGKTCIERSQIFCSLPDQYGKLITESTSDNYFTITN